MECGHCDSPPGRADHIDFKVEYGVTVAHSPGSREFSFTINFHPWCPGETDHTRQNTTPTGRPASVFRNERSGPGCGCHRVGVPLEHNCDGLTWMSSSDSTPSVARSVGAAATSLSNMAARTHILGVHPQRGELRSVGALIKGALADHVAADLLVRLGHTPRLVLCGAPAWLGGYHPTRHRSCGMERAPAQSSRAPNASTLSATISTLGAIVSALSAIFRP